MKNLISLIFIIIFFILAIIIPSWLFMMGLGNLGYQVSFVGAIPFGVLFWWLLTAIFAKK